jgi:hypothetical protein
MILTGIATAFALCMIQAVAAMPDKVVTAVAMVVKPKRNEAMECPPGACSIVFKREPGGGESRRVDIL